MTTLIKTLPAVAAGAALATSAFAQSAKEIRGASPYIAIENEPAPKLIVDPLLPEGLAHGIYWGQYRVENLRIVQVFGTPAGISTCRTPAHNRRRSSLVVGRCESQQHSRHSRAASRPA